jgi:hypothetical protein
MYNFSEWNITSKKEFIGSGAHWKVYRCFLDDSQQINTIKINQFVYKLNKHNNDNEIEENIELYKAILNAKMPTLEFYFRETFQNKDVIIAEDLNAGSCLYVSPNNAKNNSSNSKIVALLSNREIDDDYDNNAEAFLMNNKIDEINNFDDFITVICSDMDKVTKSELGMCEDNFFFGVKKNQKVTDITYKIADFETIMTNSDGSLAYSEEIVLKNTMTMLNSFCEFIMLFVSDVKRPIYQRNVENRIIAIRKKLESMECV